MIFLTSLLGYTQCESPSAVSGYWSTQSCIPMCSMSRMCISNPTMQSKNTQSTWKLKDIGKIVTIQNILLAVAEIALILYSLENVPFLHTNAHRFGGMAVWKCKRTVVTLTYLILLLIVSGEKSAEKSKTGPILKPQQFQQLPKWCTQTTPRTHFSKKRRCTKWFTTANAVKLRVNSTHVKGLSNFIPHSKNFRVEIYSSMQI